MCFVIIIIIIMMFDDKKTTKLFYSYFILTKTKVSNNNVYNNKFEFICDVHKWKKTERENVWKKESMNEHNIQSCKK